MAQQFDLGKLKSPPKETREAREDKAPISPEQAAQDMARQAADAQAVRQARGRLSTAFISFLNRLDIVQKLNADQMREKVEADYQVWLAFFEMMKGEFKDLWDFFGVVEQDVEGWFCAAPHGGPWDFLGHSREGYNFAACIEQNHKPGAPFPKKWLMVSLGYEASWSNGIGDERMLGSNEPVSDTPRGLASCKGKTLEEQLKAAEEMKKRVTEMPLVFQMYSEKVGQKVAQVPVSALESRSLTELCKGLFTALNKDVLTDFAQLLPEGQKLGIGWKDK